jgi:hypothetical protein
MIKQLLVQKDEIEKEIIPYEKTSNNYVGIVIFKNNKYLIMIR